MKVLLVQKMAGISGSERYFLGILPELRRRGVDASFLVVQHPANAPKNTAFIEELERTRIPVHVFDARLPLSPVLIWRLARLIRQEGIDILQTNLIHADVWGALVKMLFLRDLPLVSVKHGYSDSFQSAHGLDPEFLRPDALSLATRWAARHADQVVSISAGLQQFLVKGGLVAQDKACVIPYGFDFSKAVSIAAPGTVRFGTPQIVVAGRLVAVKQHHLLLAVLPELVREFPQLSVAMVGAGPLLEDLRSAADALGVSAHVRWEGFRSNMHDYIRDSDLMVIPSSAEGFGLVVLEAWHHAKPVVAFDVPAINEIVQSGTDGELVAPFNTAELLRVLRNVLSDPRKLSAMGAAGQRKQFTTYGIGPMSEKTITVFEHVLDRVRGAERPLGNA